VSVHSANEILCLRIFGSSVRRIDVADPEKSPGGCGGSIPGGSTSGESRARRTTAAMLPRSFARHPMKQRPALRWRRSTGTTFASCRPASDSRIRRRRIAPGRLRAQVRAEPGRFHEGYRRAVDRFLDRARAWSFVFHPRSAETAPQCAGGSLAGKESSKASSTACSSAARISSSARSQSSTADPGRSPRSRWSS